MLREYKTTDRDVCIDVFKSNVPEYFREHELNDFLNFLDTLAFPYFVILEQNEVVACGGYALRDDSKCADLCWGMVRHQLHSKNYGKMLLMFRLKSIASFEHITAVRLGTSQLTKGFFQKYGFLNFGTQPNGIAPGLDDVEMRMELTPDVRSEILDKWDVMVEDRG